MEMTFFGFSGGFVFLFVLALIALIVACIACVQAYGGYVGTMEMLPPHFPAEGLYIALTPGSTAKSGSVTLYNTSGSAAAPLNLVDTQYRFSRQNPVPKGYALMAGVSNITNLAVTHFAPPTGAEQGKLSVSFSASSVPTGTSVLYYYVAL